MKCWKHEAVNMGCVPCAIEEQTERLEKSVEGCKKLFEITQEVLEKIANPPIVGKYSEDLDLEPGGIKMVDTSALKPPDKYPQRRKWWRFWA